MKKIILFFTFSIFLSFYSSAQTTNNEKALEIIKKINEKIEFRLLAHKPGAKKRTPQMEVRLPARDQAKPLTLTGLQNSP